jgi:predicted Zn-dependent protease
VSAVRRLRLLAPLVVALAGCGAARPPGAAGSAPTPEAYEQYLLGAIAAENGDSETAAARFEAAIALDPGDPFLRVEFAKALMACGRFDRARAELDRALAADPASAEAKAALAELTRPAPAP